MADIVLNVEVREKTGTGGARSVRGEAKVPGILYGGGKDPVAIAVNDKDFKKALYTGKLLGHLVTLQYGTEKQPVIAKDVQFHPVSDAPVHFDLMRVDENASIKINIPVHFKNQELAPGIKRGGSLSIVRHDVEVLAPATAIPEELVVDLTGLDIGDTVRASALPLPKGVTLTVADRDFVIATISGHKEETEATEGAEGGEAADEAGGEE
ncbi:MAG: 50S ribosomal protein L25/general stress protein Ctc [Caulobacteraceae bacterium]|nr:50S ribosomal protein L25/general stress protein Ctc [Caulobacteraceae bacterium]